MRSNMDAMSTTRARSYARWCRSCRRLDDAAPLIASSVQEAGTVLRAEEWTCPHCGGAGYEVTSPYQDGDLDDVPMPIASARLLRPDL